MIEKLKFSIFILALSVTFCSVSAAQDCNASITNVQFQTDGELLNVKFDLSEAVAYEISLYNKSSNTYLLDNSNLQPLSKKSSIALSVRGNSVMLSSVENSIDKSFLAVVLIRKDNTCDPLKIDLK